MCVWIKQLAHHPITDPSYVIAGCSLIEKKTKNTEVAIIIIIIIIIIGLQLHQKLPLLTIKNMTHTSHLPKMIKMLSAEKFDHKLKGKFVPFKSAQELYYSITWKKLKF